MLQINWAGDPTDRKSNSGLDFKLANGPISWGCKKQKPTAFPTAEADYMALALATQECCWIQGFLNELDFKRNEKPVRIFEDNQTCIFLTKNPIQHQKSKH